MWQTGIPPANVLVKIKGSDCFGTWTAIGKRKDYKKPLRGRTWRWVDENEIPIVDVVEAWAHFGSPPYV